MSPTSLLQGKYDLPFLCQGSIIHLNAIITPAVLIHYLGVKLNKFSFFILFKFLISTDGLGSQLGLTTYTVSCLVCIRVKYKRIFVSCVTRFSWPTQADAPKAS